MLRTLMVKDLRRWWSDRNSVVVSLALPLLLTAVFGFSFGGFGGGGGIGEIEVAVVGDPPAMARGLLDRAMEQTGLFVPVWTDSLAADRMVRRGEVKAALLLPDDFLQRFFSQDRVRITLWRDVNSSVKAGIVEQVIRRMLSGLRAGEAAYYGAWRDDWYPDDAAGDPIADVFAGDSLSGLFRSLLGDSPETAAARGRIETLLDHQLALRDAFAETAVDMEVVAKGEAAGSDDSEPEDFNLFNIFLPAMAVFFLMFSANSAGVDLHRERRAGTLRRLFCSPLAARDLLLGKWLFATANGTLQLAVLLLCGRVFFGVDTGADPLALPAVSVFTAGSLAALFLPLSMLTRSEKQNDQLGTGLVLGLAIIGGSFIPVEMAPPFMRVIGQAAPNFWANRAFNTVMAHGRGIGEVGLELAVLAGICLVSLAAALLLMRRRGGREGLL